jgi:hypothetical protein
VRNKARDWGRKAAQNHDFSEVSSERELVVVKIIELDPQWGIVNPNVSAYGHPLLATTSSHLLVALCSQPSTFSYQLLFAYSSLKRVFL